MRIVIAAANDAMNLAIENIVQELIKRGNQVDIFAQNMTEGSIRMFKSMNVPLHPANKLTDAMINEYDFAFCCEDAAPVFRYSDIYVFSYNFIPDTWNGVGSDFMFTMARDRKIRWHEDCASMAVGDAKNDAPRSEAAEKKQLLYIDAGHIPYGVKAKHQVAQMLLDICTAFPDYDLVVKPRWLRGENVKQTHRSALHIYTVLEELTSGYLPDNLILLDEHRNLQELIDQSVSVITTSINCWIDAASREKGCLVVDGFDAEEQFESRATVFDSYQAAKRAGCVVRFNEVVDHLPDGIACNNEYFHHRIPYSSGVSAKIVDIMEYTYNTFLKDGKYPVIKEYDYETFQEDAEPDETLTIAELKYNRFKNAVCSHFNYNQFEYIGETIDSKPYFEYAKQIYKDYPLNRDGFRRLSQMMAAKRREIIIQNSELCMQDDISQAVLFMQLAEDGKGDTLFNIPKEQILCVGPYHYHLGMLFGRLGDKQSALSHLAAFLREANGRTFNKYPQENDWGIRNAYNYLFNHYTIDDEGVAPEEFADICYALFAQRDETVVSYPSRQRVHAMLPKIAERLAESDPGRALICLQLFAQGEYHYRVREKDDRIKALTREINLLRSAKWYRLKEKIKWIFRKLKGGIKCYQEHGWKYTIHRIKEHLNNYCVKFTAFKIYMNFKNRILAGFETYSKLVAAYGDKTVIHLPAGGNGDIYLALEYYDPYVKKYYPDRVNVFVSSNYSCETLCNLFKVDNMWRISTKQYEDLIHLFVFSDAVNIDILHHHIYLRHTGILTALEGIHGLNFMEFLKAAVFDGLEPAKPYGDADREVIRDVFAANGLEPGKTVVLAPYANNIAPIPELYWIILVRRLLERGLSVCTNVYGTQKPIEETPPVDLPLSDMVEFLDQAGYLVSRRSGFDDVTHGSTCKRVEVYPRRLYTRSLVATTPECFAYVADPVIVGTDNISECVEETMLQLGLIGEECR